MLKAADTTTSMHEPYRWGMASFRKLNPVHTKWLQKAKHISTIS